MKDNLKIAWRNLWRNSRRTLITAASVFFGVFFAVFMSSLQVGSFKNMVDNMVRFYSGYIQIQGEGFRENRSLNQSFVAGKSLDSLVHLQKAVTQTTQRIESFTLASFGNNSSPAMIFGIQPEKEEAISGVSKWLSAGTFLQPGSKDILLGKQLAENLGVSVGDTAALIGQGYHGLSAAGIYKVAGLLDFPLPELNRRIVYMNLATCQDFFSMPDRITSYVIMIDEVGHLKKTVASIRPSLNNELRIYSWEDLQPQLVNLIEGKLAAGKFIKGLLFMIIGFGVWATVIMMMYERKRELGVMIALGFQKTRIFIMLVIEAMLIGLIGVIAGMVVSYPLVRYLFYNPVHVTGKMAETYRSMGFEPLIAFGKDTGVFLMPALTIFIIFTIIAFYQMWFVARLKTVDALHI
ncbi:MAG TPA: ABC transporter permease [Bacteroidetes bacterium]|nr:ABC transporter permease [Bacteroidota bacterium]